jgi:hypothetical protein
MIGIDMIEIELLKDKVVIEETLNRIGIANKKRKILYPTCYLYQNYEKFYIMHFKELFLLTRPTGFNNMSVGDYTRKHSIIWCLINWGLIKLPDNMDVNCIEPHNMFVFVLPHKEKKEWTIQDKFNTNNIQFAE